MLIEDIVLVIMSSGRANRIITHKKFPKDMVDWVIAVPKSQEKEYALFYGIERILPIPSEIPSFIAPHRQWVMEHLSQYYKYIWLMDDDLTYLKRTEDLKLIKCETEDVQEMILDVRKQLEKYAVVSISPRLGNNRVVSDYQDVGRMMDSYAFNSEIYIKEGINFAPYPEIIGEDFHVTLTYLNKGYPNRIIFKYSQSDGGRNAEGGCSLFRTNEVQRKASFWMADNHPEVKVKVKSSHNWEGLDGQGKENLRVDMTVQWKQAYKPKKVRQEGGLSRILNKNK